MNIARTTIVHYPIVLPDGSVQDNTIERVAMESPGLTVVEGVRHVHRPTPKRPEFEYAGGLKMRID